MEQSRGGIILLDFKAAFPSISHTYLHKVLSALGLPDYVCTAVKNLYCNHHCLINFQNIQKDGFDISAGIRQGCPLSPLIFALVIDLVLRRIKRRLPSALIKAFADDIAIVVNNVGEAMGLLQEIVEELELIAGLGFNRPKCVLIPLWGTTSKTSP
jgi:hypothetical protein